MPLACNPPGPGASSGGAEPNRNSYSYYPEQPGPQYADGVTAWGDDVFHAKDGPAFRAKAVLLRYADDFVAMTRYGGRELQEFIEQNRGLAKAEN